MTTRALLATAAIVAPIAAGGVALTLLTDLGQPFAWSVWIAPVVVLIPYAYSPPARRPYGIWTVAAALVLPTVAAVWVVWRILAYGLIGHHP